MLTSRAIILAAIVRSSLRCLNPLLTPPAQLLHGLDNVSRAGGSGIATRDVHMATFETVHTQFDRFAAAATSSSSSSSSTEAPLSGLDAEAAKSQLTEILFGVGNGDGRMDLPEAMRLQRAKAVAAVERFRKGLVAPERVREAVSMEKSAVVRKELESVL